jgi:hypothetical protein
MSYLGNSPGVSSQRNTTTITATAGQTTFTTTSGYQLGYIDVFLNGTKLVSGDDFTASNGTSITLTIAADVGDAVELVSYIPRGLSDGYTKLEADAKYLIDNISSINNLLDVDTATTTPTNGQTLVWNTASSKWLPGTIAGGVTSIAGTADQIAASTSTGAITLSLPQSINTTSSPSFANVTLTGELRGPATLIIDPAAVGDDTGTVRVRGNLQVDGTTTTVNSTTLEVADLNIVLGKNAVNAAAATGAGITIGNYASNPSILYNGGTDNFAINRSVAIVGTLSATGALSVTDTTASTSTTTGAVKVSGGLGVAGAIYAGNIYSNGVQLTAGGSAAGTTGQLQFNSSGSFGGLSSLTWTSATSLFTLSNADIKIVSASGLFHLAVDADTPGWATPLGDNFASKGISINENNTTISASSYLVLGQGNTAAMGVSQGGRVWFGPDAAFSSNYNATVNIQSTLVTGNTQSYNTDYCFTGVYSPTVSFSAVKEGGAGGADFIGFTNSTTASVAPSLNIARSRGAHVDNQDNVASGDTVGYVTGWGMVAYGWKPVSQLEFYIDGAATSSNTEGAIRLRTYANNTSNIRLNISNPGHITPGSDNAQDLGSFTARWRNIYTADMHFSNEGSQNSVDGTWGNWTLQEGKENIYMLNNRTGRRYKIVLEEV